MGDTTTTGTNPYEDSYEEYLTLRNELVTVLDILNDESRAELSRMWGEAHRRAGSEYPLEGAAFYQALESGEYYARIIHHFESLYP